MDSYESAGVVPRLYKSFLWGQDGASVYATMNVKHSLQEYDTNRVLSLLTADTVQRTLLNFPLNRSLDVSRKFAARNGALKAHYEVLFGSGLR